MLVGCKKIEWQGMTDVFSQRKLLRMHPINVNQNSKLKPVQNGPIKWLIDNSINSTLTYFKISVWQLKFQQ